MESSSERLAVSKGVGLRRRLGYCNLARHRLGCRVAGADEDVSVPSGVGGFEEGEFEGDSPAKEVAAEVSMCWANPVQLCAEEIDKAAKVRVVVQYNPLGVHEVVWKRLRRARRPVEIEPFGHDEDRERGGIAARLRRLAHNRLESGGRRRIG